MEPRTSTPNEDPAVVAEFPVAEPGDERPTSLGLTWHNDVVDLAPELGAKESWLTPSATTLQLHFQSLDNDEPESTTSVVRGRLCYEVASLWFKLFEKHGVGLLVAESWFRKCEAELKSNGELSDDEEELQDDVERLRKKFAKVAGKTIEKRQEPLVSGSVRAIILKVKSLEEGDDWNRKAWSVLAMRAITELLDALSKVGRSTYTNKQISAVFYSQQLGELFALVKNKALQAWYSSESERMSQLVGLPLQEAGGATSIVAMIEDAIKVSKSVGEIFNMLSEKANLELSTYERSYITSRLIRYNLEQFETEVDSLMKQSSWQDTKILLDSLGQITKLEHVPAPFKDLKVCEVLLANKEHVSNKDEQICISKFKIACLNHQISLFGPKDIALVDAVHTVLRTCADVDFVSQALGLRAFYEERENACGKLVTRILEHSSQSPDSDEAMMSLYSVARDLEGHADQWSVEEKLKELVWSYIHPVEVRKAVLDGRQVVEVKCKKTTLSKVLPVVLPMFEDPRVEEVRFVVPDCLRLDANLDVNVWHGVNVYIQTKILQVAKQVVLDVSGSRGTPEEYHRKAADGKKHGESGEKGNDGFAGESGGNVTIVAEEIDHLDWLTVLSRGGDGGKGQDGGDGMHGKDGFTHTFKSLNEFLGQNSFINWHHATLVEILGIAAATRIVWNAQKNFYHIKTHAGGEIMYSYNWDTAYAYTAHTPWHNHSFFIHKGGPGMAGGQGGKPGRGGAGGYGGMVEIISKRLKNTQSVVNGTNGNSGRPGKDSSSGKSGYDIAFTPNETTAATWYGENSNAPKLLEVQFTTSKPSGNWTWSPFKNQYALIVESNRTVSFQQSVQEKKRDTSKLQTQASANKKKNISTANMLNTYQAYADSAEMTSVIRENFEEMLERETLELRTLSAISVQEKLRVGVRSDKLGAEELAPFSESSMEPSINKIKRVDIQTAEEYVADMVANPSAREKWMNLKYFVPSAEQFQRLFKAQDTVSSSTDLKQLLLDKYRTNSLQIIAKHGDNSFGLFRQQQPGGPIEKYLFGEKKPTLENDPSAQASVRQHFDKLQRLYGHQDDTDRTLRRAIKYFADDAKKKSHNTELKKYMDECAVLEAAKDDAWQRYLKVLEKNPETYDLWVRAYNGERVDKELRAAIAQDQAAQAALVTFCTAPVYDWRDAAKDEKVLKEVSTFLAASGSLSSGCFREILADATKQHIRVYSRDDDDREASFKLSTEHGEKHSSKLYVHQTPRGKFRQLKFNSVYFDMECKRRHKSDVFAFALKKINTLKTKEDVDSFFRDLVPLEKLGGRIFEEFVQSHTSKVEGFDKKYESNFDDNIASLLKHFPSSTRSFLSSKLELLHPRYAPNGFVSNLARRLAVEQLQVSSEVVHWLVDLAVEAVADDNATLGLCEFIAAANRQEDWAAEMLLIQIDNYLQAEISSKNDLRGSLTSLSDQVVLLLLNKLNKYILSGKVHRVTEDKIKYLISKLIACGTDVTAKLRDASIGEWVYVLEEITWKKKLETLTVWNEEQLHESIHFLSTLAWKRGHAVVTLVLGRIAEKNLSELSATAVLELLFYLKSDDCQLPNQELSTFVESLSFADWNNNGKKRLTSSQNERNLSDLTAIIKNNANTSQNFLSSLEKISAGYKDVKTLSIAQAKETAKQLQSMLSNDKSSSLLDENSLKMCIDLVGAIDSVIKTVMKFNLRATQKLSALMLLVNKNKSLIQVATGEGKTMIVLVVAIIKALCGQKVHVVTSSSVLAKRDATSKENVQIYSEFGVTVSHNCSENVEERRSAYSTSQVVYGDLPNFQRDHLLDSFYQKNIMGDHTRKEIMIIDEVDSMLIDKGNNMLYLSHDIGDLDKLDCVFAFIWQRINDPSLEVTTQFDVDLIKSKIVSDLYASITREDLQLLDRTLSLVQVEELWDRLRNLSIIGIMGVLIGKDNWNKESLLKACSFPEHGVQHTILADRVRFLLEQRRDREKAIEVPNFLKPFVALHVDVWVKNAIQAMSMEENQDYVVDVDRGNVSADVFPIVTILDKDTGTDQANSQWDGGLHQFLQIKHGCKLSALSLKAVFISNVTYFKLYSNIYGMTGTLGTSKEKEMLQRVHGVDFVVMPTFKPKKFVELPPVVCASRRDWIAGVLNEVRDMLDAKGRAALVICETIEEVHTLSVALRKAGRDNVHTYTRDYETFELPGGKLEPGHVVVATNLAGRGTDIKPTKSLLAAGGLHVVVTYLPRSGRVEKQAFGRAARKGDPGTGRLVVCVPDESGTSTLRVTDMRALRDAKSHDATEEFYKNQILGEEACMLYFEELYKKQVARLSSANYPDKLQHALLQFSINKWALWLDRNETILKTMNKGQRNKSIESELCLHKYISDTYDPDEVLSLLPILDQPSTIVKIGKYFLDINANTSLKLFAAVVEREPHFSESALYYKCSARVKLMHETHGVGQRKKNESGVREDLRLAVRAIDRRKSSVMQTTRMISSVRKQKVRVTEKDAFQVQAENLLLVYESFEKSIDEICGAPTSSFLLGGGDEELGERVEKDLIKAGILRCVQARDPNEIPRTDMEKLCSDYGVTYENMNDFLTIYKVVDDVKQFEKTLKEKINVRNKESFWEILSQKKFLREESELVAITKGAEHIKTSYPNLKNISYEDDTDSNVFLYSEQLPATSETITYFKKSELVNEIGDEKYKKLLKKKEATALKRAVIEKEAVQGTKFLWADFVTFKDLESTGICTQDAVLIMRELEAQKILERRGDLLFLVSHEFHDTLELSLQLYEQTVVNFLDVFFAYDQAFARIQRSVAENPSETAFQIPLISNPHRGLLMEMFECGVLERVRVDPEYRYIKNDVKKLFTYELEATEIEKACKENKHTREISQEEAKDLFTLFQGSKWLSGATIQGPETRQSLASSQFSDLEPALGKFFDTRFKLASMADSLAKKLEHGRGLLTTLDYPSASLKLLSDEAKTQAVNIEELSIFTLNGFDHLIILGEKKYTIWMILSAAAVIVMGICQIVAGILIELYSIGTMTHVGGALIGEGIGDIMYGISAFCKGEFSWKDYGIHKALSITISVATAGVGALLNRGVQASRFGVKLLGAATGKRVVGKALLREVGAKKLFRVVAKRVALRTGKSVAKGLTGIGVSYATEHGANYICVKLAAEVAKMLDAVFDSSKALQWALANVLGALGLDGAHVMVLETASTLIGSEGVKSEWERFAVAISFAVLGKLEAVDGIGIAAKMARFTVQSLQIVKSVGDVVNICEKFVDKLQANLNKKNYKKNKEQDNKELAVLNERVKKEVKNMLADKIAKMLKNDLVRPIIARSSSLLFEKVVNLRLPHSRLQPQGDKPDNSGLAVVTQRHTIVGYMRKTLALRKDPILFARMILANVSLGPIGLQAIASAVSKMTQTKVTIAVKGDGTKPAQSYSGQVGKTGTWPQKVVQVGVDSEGGLDIDTSARGGRWGTHHLFARLALLLPGVVNASQFQQRLAEVLRTDVEIQRAVRRGWHLEATRGISDTRGEQYAQAIMESISPAPQSEPAPEISETAMA